ncbi:hypothetical protein [Hyphomicrobium sp.]|jgi:hypothetical protein|uniref:hypothetical protein n=1 Tax=Hyphomicrobium sp. TaxID=82 RepID=UPI002BC5BEB4|nr:hypothetical protein [Hyphomicrobium sp.]HVZ05899.1 hypothetical protein [Hyphomicrobium sp.]
MRIIVAGGDTVDGIIVIGGIIAAGAVITCGTIVIGAIAMLGGNVTMAVAITIIVLTIGRITVLTIARMHTASACAGGKRRHIRVSTNRNARASTLAFLLSGPILSGAPEFV